MFQGVWYLSVGIQLAQGIVGEETPAPPLGSRRGPQEKCSLSLLPSVNVRDLKLSVHENNSAPLPPGKGYTRNPPLNDQFQDSINSIAKKFLGPPEISPAIVQAYFLLLSSFL